MYPRKIIVATRPSKLSLIQTYIAIDWIKKFYPDIQFEIRTFKSTGDKIQDKALYEIGVKGIFEKEINLAVLREEADIAIHSLKDLPAEINPELEIVCYPPRDSPYDVIVTRLDMEPSIEKLPSNSIIGTSSLRRKAFILRKRPDLKIEVIRGNVDTRIRKLLEGKYDAIIIAECGIERFEKFNEKFPIKYSRLSIYDMPPAPGQGIIAIVCRKNDNELVNLLKSISHKETTIEAICERTFLKYMKGGCHIPLGCIAQVKNNELHFYAAISNYDGSKVYTIELKGSINEPEYIGKKAAELLKEKAGNLIEELELEKEKFLKSKLKS